MHNKEAVFNDVTAEISLAALSHNLGKIKQCAPDSKVIAMIKANAYGHGVLTVAQYLDSNSEHRPEAFGVARLSEGLALRKSGIKAAIVLLEGVWLLDEVELAAEHHLQLIVHHLDQLSVIEEFSVRAHNHKAVKIWLKLDTGMHRLGLKPEQLDEAKQRLVKCTPAISSKLGLLTHFACSDEKNNPFTSVQLECFQAHSAGFTDTSMANSAAIFDYPETHSDWNRPGIALYGVSPLPSKSSLALGLKPVMTLKSKVIAIRTLLANESSGYGCTWVSSKDTTLAVIAIGYGDGYPRHAPSGTPVLIAGKIYPLAGRISMDMIVVDLGNNSGVCQGDDVTLWGEGLPVEEIAEAAGTIAYELLCSVTSRVQFIYR